MKEAQHGFAENPGTVKNHYSQSDAASCFCRRYAEFQLSKVGGGNRNQRADGVWALQEQRSFAHYLLPNHRQWNCLQNCQCPEKPIRRSKGFAELRRSLLAAVAAVLEPLDCRLWPHPFLPALLQFGVLHTDGRSAAYAERKSVLGACAVGQWVIPVFWKVQSGNAGLESPWQHGGNGCQGT